MVIVGAGEVAVYCLAHGLAFAVYNVVHTFLKLSVCKYTSQKYQGLGKNRIKARVLKIIKLCRQSINESNDNLNKKRLSELTFS